MVLGARRILGVTLPPLKHFGPVLIIWGVAMVALLLLLGHRLVADVLRGAARRCSTSPPGGSRSWSSGCSPSPSARGTWATHIPHVNARVEDWLHPFDRRLYNAIGGSFQVANGIFAQAAGGLFGQGFGESILTVDAARRSSRSPRPT